MMTRDAALAYLATLRHPSAAYTREELRALEDARDAANFLANQDGQARAVIGKRGRGGHVFSIVPLATADDRFVVHEAR